MSQLAQEATDGGFRFCPGDLVVPDHDGVLVVPQRIAHELANGAFEQEEQAALLLERVAGGAALPGTYRPDEATRLTYRTWRKGRPSC